WPGLAKPRAAARCSRQCCPIPAKAGRDLNRPCRFSPRSATPIVMLCAAYDPNSRRRRMRGAKSSWEGNMSGFGEYLSWAYVIRSFGSALAYGVYIYRGVQVKRAGGLAAHSRAHLDRLFQMPPGARVTAAWEAVTIPKKSGGQKAVEAASIVFAS